MPDPLREALEFYANPAVYELQETWRWTADGPKQRLTEDTPIAHDGGSMARAALAASPAPVRDGCDHAAELREARAVAGLALTFIPADQFERFQEKCRAILLDPDALAASSTPARVEWRVAWRTPSEDRVSYLSADGEQARAHVVALNEMCAAGPRYVLQRSECGPWVDVPAEGEGDA